MLVDISMIIPTKDRQQMLQQIIEYHAPTRMQILIADGTETPWQGEHTLTQYPRVRYFHMPEQHFHERIHSLMKYVDRPYCVLRADRRHQCNRAIAQCRDFLRKHTDYTSASGLWFWKEPLSLHYGADMVTEPWHINDPVKRVRCHALSFQPPFYNVQTRQLAQLRFRILTRLLRVTTHTYFLEFMDYFVMHFLGKTQLLTIFGGIVQNKQASVVINDEFYTTCAAFDTPALLSAAFAIIEKQLRAYNVCKKTLKEAFFAYIESLKLRFLLYTIDIRPHPFTKIAGFGHLEKVFDMLYDRTTEDKAYLSSVLQCLITIMIDNMTRFEDVMHHFSEADFTEADHIKTLIANITKSC